MSFNKNWLRTLNARQKSGEKVRVTATGFSQPVEGVVLDVDGNWPDSVQIQLPSYQGVTRTAVILFSRITKVEALDE